ncbi:LapA family protein [Crocinitomicaceae bacterium]|nr:LapA family protein [Crocinitomicaceae bacterium]
MKDYWNKLSFGEKAKLIFFAICGLLILIFALLNWKVYNLNLIFGKVEVPVTILILVSMFGGYAYARIYSWVKSRQQDKEISYLKGELAATREKLRKEPLESKKKIEDNKSDEEA